MQEDIVFFDGVCNLCNSTVQFLLRIDKKHRLKFGSLQGEAAKKILPAYHIQPAVLTSIVFIHQNKAYTESSAVLEIFRATGGIWTLLYIFKIIPAFLRNNFYRLIARYRYKWFGKKDQCIVPKPEYKNRFLV
jgi:predicted DCC family thiol-disulfide oxidoreductase YuxK